MTFDLPSMYDGMNYCEGSARVTLRDYFVLFEQIRTVKSRFAMRNLNGKGKESRDRCLEECINAPMLNGWVMLHPAGGCRRLQLFEVSSADTISRPLQCSRPYLLCSNPSRTRDSRMAALHHFVDNGRVSVQTKDVQDVAVLSDQVSVEIKVCCPSTHALPPLTLHPLILLLRVLSCVLRPLARLQASSPSLSRPEEISRWVHPVLGLSHFRPTRFCFLLHLCSGQNPLEVNLQPFKDSIEALTWNGEDILNKDGIQVSSGFAGGEISIYFMADGQSRLFGISHATPTLRAMS